MKNTIKAFLLISTVLGFTHISYAGNSVEVLLINKTSLSFDPQQGANLKMETLKPHGIVSYKPNLLTRPTEYDITYLNTKTDIGFKFGFYAVSGAASKPFCLTDSRRIKCTINSIGSNLRAVIESQETK